MYVQPSTRFIFFPLREKASYFWVHLCLFKPWKKNMWAIQLLLYCHSHHPKLAHDLMGKDGERRGPNLTHFCPRGLMVLTRGQQTFWAGGGPDYWSSDWWAGWMPPHLPPSPLLPQWRRTADNRVAATAPATARRPGWRVIVCRPVVLTLELF